MIGGHLDIYAAASLGILAAALFVAWRRSGVGGEHLLGNVVWAVAGASILNLALATMWFASEDYAGPAIFILTVGLPYLLALTLSRG